MANEETFRTFALVDREFPHLIKGLSTNGLLLVESLERLDLLGVGSLMVTVNALDPDVGRRIYSRVTYQGVTYSKAEGAGILIRNQLNGIAEAVERRITVKVNTVLIPGINDAQVPLIAEEVKRLGAQVMNVMPLVPQAELAHVAPPTDEALLGAARKRADHRSVPTLPAVPSRRDRSHT